MSLKNPSLHRPKTAGTVALFDADFARPNVNVFLRAHFGAVVLRIARSIRLR
jgi:hypothetical protein